MRSWAEVASLIRADYEHTGRSVDSPGAAAEMVARIGVNPSLRACLLLRLAGPKGLEPRRLWRHLLWTMHRIELENRVDIAGGLNLPHPFWISFGAGTIIESNVLISHGVTFAPSTERRTVIGRSARIYPSSTFAPGTVVGENVVVGANCDASGFIAPDTVFRTRRRSSR